MEQVKIS